jgi:cyclase
MSGAQLMIVASGVHAWIGSAGDSNAGAVETPHGLIVVDSQQNRNLAETFRSALGSSTGAPIRALMNTHFHLDHVAGNVAFMDVPILGHKKTLQAIERELGPQPAEGGTVSDALTKARMFFGGNFEELVPESERTWFLNRVGGSNPLVIRPPSETFADRLEFRLPNDVLHLEYWEPAHCDCDVVVFLERCGVVFLGDLFFHGRFPWFGDCDLNGWIASLDRVLTMNFTTVIPGHGPSASLKEVARFRDLLAAVRRAVEAAIRKGHTEDAAAHEIVLADYQDMQRYKEWMPYNIRSAYRYFRGR